MITGLRTKASSLHLGNDAALRALNGGGGLTAEEATHVAKEKRAVAAVARFVPPGRNSGGERETCAQCKKNPSTHTGFMCRCRCICGECAEEAVIECPVCGEFTEFVLLK